MTVSRGTKFQPTIQMSTCGKRGGCGCGVRQCDECHVSVCNKHGCEGGLYSVDLKEYCLKCFYSAKKPYKNKQKCADLKKEIVQLRDENIRLQTKCRALKDELKGEDNGEDVEN